MANSLIEPEFYADASGIRHIRPTLNLRGGRIINYDLTQSQPVFGPTTVGSSLTVATTNSSQLQIRADGFGNIGVYPSTSLVFYSDASSGPAMRWYPISKQIWITKDVSGETDVSSYGFRVSGATQLNGNIDITRGITNFKQVPVEIGGDYRGSGAALTISNSAARPGTLLTDAGIFCGANGASYDPSGGHTLRVGGSAQVSAQLQAATLHQSGFPAISAGFGRGDFRTDRTYICESRRVVDLSTSDIITEGSENTPIFTVYFNNTFTAQPVVFTSLNYEGNDFPDASGTFYAKITAQTQLKIYDLQVNYFKFVYVVQGQPKATLTSMNYSAYGTVLN